MRIIAHRGRHDAHRENSLGALHDAFSTGADAAELDVRLSRDGVPVLAHDGLQWHGPIPHVVAWSSARGLSFLARLEQVLAEPLPPGRDLPIVLDVKRAGQFAAVAAFCLEHTAAPGAIALWCRDRAQVSALARRAEFGELALLPRGYGANDTLQYLDDAAACGSSAVSLHPEVIGSYLVEAAHQRGMRAYAWIRSPADHAPAVQMGIDGLVTDWVDDARLAVGLPPS
ncbi:MAG: glycerophosphodiester phosphodiesterase [Jatrophihabitans sp.]